MPQTDLQNALNACSASGGGVVTFSGTVTLTSRLNLPPNVWLRGNGPATSLVAAYGFADAFMVATLPGSPAWVAISDLILDGNAANIDRGSGLGIMLQGTAPGSFIERCVLKNTMRAGICVGSTRAVSVGVRVANNTLTTCGSPLSTMETTAICAVNAIDFQILDNQIIDSPNGIDLENNPGDGSVLINGLVRGNVIRSSVALTPAQAFWGIAVQGQPGHPATNIRVSDNLLNGPTLPGAPILLTPTLNVNVISADNVIA